MGLGRFYGWLDDKAGGYLPGAATPEEDRRRARLAMIGGAQYNPTDPDARYAVNPNQGATTFSTSGPEYGTMPQGVQTNNFDPSNPIGPVPFGSPGSDYENPPPGVSRDDPWWQTALRWGFEYGVPAVMAYQSIQRQGRADEMAEEQFALSQEVQQWRMQHEGDRLDFDREREANRFGLERDRFGLEQQAFEGRNQRYQEREPFRAIALHSLLNVPTTAPNLNGALQDTTNPFYSPVNYERNRGAGLPNAASLDAILNQYRQAAGAGGPAPVPAGAPAGPGSAPPIPTGPGAPGMPPPLPGQPGYMAPGMTEPYYWRGGAI